MKRSSKNAIKHGLTASDVTIFDEVADQLEAFRDDYIKACEPDDAIETRLVEQMVFAAWKIDRAHRVEAQVFINEIKRQQYEARRPDQAANIAISNDDYLLGNTPEHLKPNIGSVFRQLSGSRDYVFPLLRYEITAERSFYRALHNLERRQERRLGRPAPAPLVIEGDFQKEES